MNRDDSKGMNVGFEIASGYGAGKQVSLCISTSRRWITCNSSLPRLAHPLRRTCKVYSSVGASFACAVWMGDRCLRSIRGRQARPNNRYLRWY